MTRGPQDPATAGFLAGDGESARHLRDIDWSSHPLGTPGRWPRELRALVQVMLGARAPMCVFWGRALHCLHNDAFADLLGSARMSALGAPASTVWPELAQANAGDARTVERAVLRETGDGVGGSREVRLPFSCIAVRTADGAAAGMVCTADPEAVLQLAEHGGARGLVQVLESISDSFLAIDRSWRITYANRPALALASKRRDELVGRLLWEALPSVKDSVLEPVYRRAMAGESVRMEVLGPHSGRWLDLAVHPTPEGIAVYARDVSERRETEDALRKSETRLRLVTDALPALIAYVDADERYQFNNHAYADWFGIPAGELQGKLLREVLGDEAYARLRPAVRRVLAGEPVSFEALVPYRDAGLRRIEASYVPDRAESGEIRGFHAMVIDVSARRRAEQALRESDERYRALFETMDEGFCTIEMLFDESGKPCDYRFLETNPAFEAQTGLTDVRGKRMRELVPGHEQHRFDVYGRVARTGESTRFEERAEGLGRWYEVHAYRVGPPDAHQVAVLFNDLTERRRDQHVNRFLVELDDALRPLVDPDEITATAARLLGEHLAADRCAYADVEDDQDTFNLTGDHSRGVPSIVGRYRFTEFGAECKRLMHAGEPYVVEDAEQDPRTAAERDAYRRTWIRAVICAPLLKRGRFVAAMAVHQARPRRWLPHEIALVQQVAARCWESIERARVVRALRESEGRLQQIAQSVDAVLYVIEVPERRVRYLSPAFERVWRLDPRELYADQRAWTRRIHPDDHARVRQAFAAFLAGGPSYDAEYRVRLPDGGERWVHDRTSVAARDASGAITRVSGIAEDVTERKRNEALFAAQREALELVVSGAGLEDVLRYLVRSVRDHCGGGCYSALFLVEPDGAHLRLAAELGFTPEQARALERFALGPDSTGCARAAATGHTVVLDDVAADPLWKRDPVLSQLASIRACWSHPIRTFGGKVLGTFSVYYDAPRAPAPGDLEAIRLLGQTAALVIERHREAEVRARSEEALRESVAELERRGRERAELLESERAARMEAERATRLKDDFVATLSHELRTPINAVLGWAQLGRLGALKSAEESARAFEVIERNARVQAQLISDLLDVSRIVTGKLRLDVRAVDPREVVEDALLAVAQSAEDKGVTLERALDPDAGPVAGDPGRLQQVVWNLLTNAIKFTPSGGRVRAALQRVESRVRITVEDSGRGIEPEFLPFLFERFRQADSSTTRRAGGLGLGLAISKQLVDLHGGTIHATSAGLGQGAMFVVTLPVAAVRARAGGERQSDDEVHGTALVSLAGVRVLVVDDEQDARELVQRVLVEREAEVVTVGSAREALDELARARPAVLVSDIGMPDEDGYALVRKLRALPAAAGGAIPAIALTAYARAEDRTRALMAGFQAHVTKPVEAEELCATIATLLGRTGRDPASGQ